jgi:SAM-dependent methyltransferase
MLQAIISGGFCRSGALGAKGTVQHVRLADPADRATLRRSVRLFGLFLREQSEPDAFYSQFAADSVAMLGGRAALEGASVLDVGGGPGYFARSFTAAGARYIGVEVDEPTDAPAAAFAGRGSGTALPFRTGSVDVTYCSNVLEHVQDGWRLADELVRVTRPGGTVFLSFTPWFGPWGGHETAPWHYLGGRRAADRYARRHGHRPKNDYGTTLFGYRVAEALTWARRQPDADLVLAFPRYHPRWAWWVLRVPGLREVVTWNLALVLRKR